MNVPSSTAPAAAAASTASAAGPAAAAPLSGAELDSLRARFALDRYATDRTGARIDKVVPPQRPGDLAPEVVCSLDLDEGHRNATGGVMGGVSFTLADFVFAVASNGFEGDSGTVTGAASIQFAGAPRGSRLVATGRPLRAGRTAAFYEVRVEDDTGRLVAVANLTGFRSPNIPKPPQNPDK